VEEEAKRQHLPAFPETLRKTSNTLCTFIPEDNIKPNRRLKSNIQARTCWLTIKVYE
jgi:hypothetical protein